MAVAKSLDKTEKCRTERSEGSLRRLRDSHRTGVRRKCRSRRTRSLTSSRCSFWRATQIGLCYSSPEKFFPKICHCEERSSLLSGGDCFVPRNDICKGNCKELIWTAIQPWIV